MSKKSLATGLIAAAVLILSACDINDQTIATRPPDGTAIHHTPTSTTPTEAQLEFHDQMRKLWEDHVTWTRLAIVQFAAEDAGLGATVERLQTNQDDIGNAIEPYYGAEAADQLSALLHEHITGAVALLQAATTTDMTAIAAANDAWHTNGDQIADFLAAANPENWLQEEMRAAMDAHLTQTYEEAVAELTGDYEASVAAYEVVHHHILTMADILSSGIIAQFPDKF